MGRQDVRRMDWSVLEPVLKGSTPADLRTLERLVAAARSGRLDEAMAAERTAAQKEKRGKAKPAQAV